MMCLTDFQGENTLRDYQGTGLLVIITTVVSISLGRSIISAIKWAKLKLKRKVKKSAAEGNKNDRPKSIIEKREIVEEKSIARDETQ